MNYKLWTYVFLISFIAMVVLYASKHTVIHKDKPWLRANGTSTTVVFTDTVPLMTGSWGDSIAQQYADAKPPQAVKEKLDIGDTVIYDVIGHGWKTATVKATDDDYYYLKFFNCNCNGWYRHFPIFRPILHYSNTWNQ